MLKNTKDQFGTIAKVLHWLIGLTIIGLIGLGAWMVTLDYYDAWYHDGLSLHKAVGMVVLAVVFFKLVWLWITPEPDQLPTLTWWERAGAAAVHKALIGLMVLMPLTGFLVSTSEGAGVSVFGLFEVPAVLVAGAKFRDLAIAIHFYLAYGGAALIVLHVVAALKHHFFNKDRTLRRML
ncbi:MAG: hypothetical protein A2516_04345 [Alphaproteobacteria bacterium RIFOXYD12_FULL_60_8]|nr:MAG: hypothetical protein A2516_04345 [Alphaproteobacteria bacterium RIFOXYD12_FULL_60_8]